MAFPRPEEVKIVKSAPRVDTRVPEPDTARAIDEFTEYVRGIIREKLEGGVEDIDSILIYCNNKIYNWRWKENIKVIGYSLCYENPWSTDIIWPSGKKGAFETIEKELNESGYYFMVDNTGFVGGLSEDMTGDYIKFGKME